MASLVAQWWIHPLLQETGVWSLIRKDPTYWQSNCEPVGHSYWACALEPLGTATIEPLCHNCWTSVFLSLCLEAKEAIAIRNLCNAMRSSPCLLQLEKSPCSNKNPAQPKINNFLSYIYIQKEKLSPSDLGYKITRKRHLKTTILKILKGQNNTIDKGKFGN